MLTSGLNLEGSIKDINVIDKGIENIKPAFSWTITKYTWDDRYKDN